MQENDVRLNKIKNSFSHTVKTCVSSVAVNFLALAVPVLTIQMYDRIIPNPASGTLPVLSVCVCVAILLEAMMRMARAYMLNWKGAQYEYALTHDAMMHMLQSNIASLKSVGIGEHLQRMISIGKSKDFKNDFALTVYIDLLFVPVYITLIAMIAGPLATVPAVILMLYSIISLFQGQTLRRALQSREKSDNRRYNFLIEALEGIHTVKSFALENMFSRRYEDVQDEASKANFHVTRALSLTFNTNVIFAHIMLLAVTCVGALLSIKGILTTGALIASVLMSGRIMQPIQKALSLWARYQDYSIADQKIRDIFEMPLHKTGFDDMPPVNKLGTVSLRNLSYEKEADGVLLLDNFNLELQKGESVLIHGENDEARTVLLELIAGIYPASRGEILIDDCNILRYSPTEIAGHIGYISADALIFRGTIRDNMTCFGQIEEKQAQEIADLLGVREDVAKLPAGFDTPLSGSGADNIPPGLKQRIAFVRALARKPRIILFDHADRSLDRNGYHFVYSLLAQIKGKATFIMATDDVNLQKLTDRRIEIGLVENPQKAAA